MYTSIENLETTLEGLAPSPSEAHEYPIQDLETLVSSWKSAIGVEDVSKWVLGDIALEAVRSAQKEHPDASEKSILKEFAALTGDEYSSMRVYTWVSKAFGERSKRKTGLSWSHYRVTVATNDPEAWINVAVEEHLSVRGLEQRIKEAGGGTIIEALCCTKCMKSLIDSPTKLTLYNDSNKEATFCSYACLGAYAFDIEAAKSIQLGSYNNQDTADLIPVAKEEQFA